MMIHSDPLSEIKEFYPLAIGNATCKQMSLPLGNCLSKQELLHPMPHPLPRTPALLNNPQAWKFKALFLSFQLKTS